MIKQGHPNGMLSFRYDVSLKGTHWVLVTILDEAEVFVKPQAMDTLPLGFAGDSTTVQSGTTSAAPWFVSLTSAG